jgi:hypothetical protein
MSEFIQTSTTRRKFIETAGKLAAVSALANVALPPVHAAGSDLIQIVLIGCGGRGTGAAANALKVKRGPIKLVAMADVFPARLASSLDKLRQQKFDSPVDVPQDRQFIGFDAYKQAMDCLKPGDIAILATPPAFRWVHFTYAIQKGLNVFMEKPLTADGPTSKKMLSLAQDSSAKNLKVGVGLMSRHSRALQELAKRVHDGKIGQIVLQRGYRMAGGNTGFFRSLPKPDGITDLLYQIQRFHSFIWASGGCFNDFNIHIVDHLGWMKNAWPVKAQALGGRHYRVSPEGVTYVDQNFDTYSVEYTYPDGTKFFFDGRCVTGAEPIYTSTLQGTKGSAIASKHGDCGQPSSMYKDQMMTDHKIWESQVSDEEKDPYQNEWNDLVDAVRDDKPYNEVKRGVEASLVSSMGRMAAHTGKEITFDQMLNCEHEMAPGIDKFTMDSPAPLIADANGRYPVPQPGIVTAREY